MGAVALLLATPLRMLPMTDFFVVAVLALDATGLRTTVPLLASLVSL